ncbi:restriction endonuclease subunit S [Pseudomonas sp. J452]|uniref:restriction endonuclease subunit S n=1 Tax=Pseudomonas sp. J452 TaxID=2898441 RepID=UPI0021ADAF9A|nr:restriction endonuclease subunit S [Pseudomonas sp. J452]UUY07309.1 restriction endonuclease subunit S [Pseudomonas sp. J452]
MKVLPLGHVANVRTAVVFRSQAPQEVEGGNVRALAIRDVVAGGPLRIEELPQIHIDESLQLHCLHTGEVVLPSRGDHYRALYFEGPADLVFPLGQLNIITAGPEVNPRYLAWYLNSKSTQTKISVMLTGTSIKAFTKASLLTLDIEIPSLEKQQVISELDRNTQDISAVRQRLNNLDQIEAAFVTQTLLRRGGGGA